MMLYPIEGDTINMLRVRKAPFRRTIALYFYLTYRTIGDESVSCFSYFTCSLHPSGVQRKAVLGNAPGDNRHVCPSHLDLFICVVRDALSVFQSCSTIRIVLAQNIPSLFRRHQFSMVSSLCALVYVSNCKQNTIEESMTQKR